MAQAAAFGLIRLTSTKMFEFSSNFYVELEVHHKLLVIQVLQEPILKDTYM